jgi:hypothetical protein
LLCDIRRYLNAVPDPRFIAVGNIASIDGTVSNIDQAIVAEANRERRLVEAIDSLGAHCDETVESFGGRTRLYLEAQRVVRGRGSVAAPPSVSNCGVQACAGTSLAGGRCCRCSRRHIREALVGVSLQVVARVDFTRRARAEERDDAGQAGIAKHSVLLHVPLK